MSSQQVQWPAELKAVLDNSGFKASVPVKLRFSVEPNASVDTAVFSQFDVEVELRLEAGTLVDRATVFLQNKTGRVLLRFGDPGLYRVTIRSLSEDRQLQTSESVQVSANVLPKSLVIIGAHPDDEFLHPAAIRAAVENSVPVHVIFLTSGDAGGSDRFFGVEYSPAEAIEFGHIRMQEAYWFYQTQGGNHARGHVLDYLHLPRVANSEFAFAVAS